MKNGQLIGLGLAALLVVYLFIKQKPQQTTNAETWQVMRDSQGFIQHWEVHRDVRSV